MIIKQVSELELYVNLLQLDKKKVYKDHNELIKDLKTEFNINTTKEQLERMYAPTLEEDVDDLRLIVKNVS